MKTAVYSIAFLALGVDLYTSSYGVTGVLLSILAIVGVSIPLVKNIK